jgi:hypothetical protein
MSTIPPQLKKRTGRGILAGRIVGQRTFKISIFHTQHRRSYLRYGLIAAFFALRRTLP